MAFILTIIGCFLAYAAYQTYQTKKDLENPVFQMLVNGLVTKYIGTHGVHPPGHVMPEIYKEARSILNGTASSIPSPNTSSPPEDESSNFGPRLKSATPVKEYTSDHFHAVLYHPVESLGIMQYQFLFIAFKRGVTRPIFFIASEINPMMSSTANSSSEPYLCVFDENGHHNLGRSSQYSAFNGFEAAALKLSQEKLNLSSPMQSTK